MGGAQQVCRGSGRDPGAEAEGPGLPPLPGRRRPGQGPGLPDLRGAPTPPPCGEALASLGLKPRPQTGPGGLPPQSPSPRPSSPSPAPALLSKLCVLIHVGTPPEQRTEPHYSFLSADPRLSPCCVRACLPSERSTQVEAVRPPHRNGAAVTTWPPGTCGCAGPHSAESSDLTTLGHSLPGGTWP